MNVLLLSIESHENRLHAVCFAHDFNLRRQIRMSRFNVNICDFENELADTKCSYNALRFPVNISEMKYAFF